MMRPIVLTRQAPAPEWPARPVYTQLSEGVLSLKLAFRITGVVDFGGRIVFHFVTAKRETGEPIHLDFVVHVSPSDARPRPQIIRDALITTLMHEIDEALELNGVRIFDPHKEDQ
jgi:hypothetical protein